MKKKLLDPADVGFLYGENRQQLMHVGSLLYYKVPEDQDASIAAKDMYEDMLSYKQAFNPFNYKLESSLGRYYWVEDQEFDIANHIRHIALPYPHDEKELFKILGVIHGIQLDRKLPLWMTWIISGLPGNRFAVYGKMHHALVDGVSGARLIQRVHSEDPNQRDMPPFWAIDRSRKGSRDIGTKPKGKVSPISHAKKTVKLAKNVVESNRKVFGTLIDQVKENHIEGTKNEMFYTPKTLVNQPITGSRRFAAGSFEIDRMKAVARTWGGSLNDTLLLMLGYSFRKYLLEMNDLPLEDMYTSMPMSVRKEGDESGGNQIAFIRARMGTNIPHTQSRIEEVTKYVKKQKSLVAPFNQIEAMLYGALTNVSFFAEGATGLFPNFQVSNLILSNVPGPQNTLYMNGYEVESMYPVSLLFNRMAVNFTVLSYNGKVNLGIVGCRRTVPHMQRFMDYMHEGLVDLERTVGIISEEKAA